RSQELSRFVDDTLTRELLAISGIARVVRQGGAEHEITVSIDPARQAALGITAADISRQLAAASADAPGGRLRLDGTEYGLRAMGRAQTLEELRNMRIALPNGREVRLGDIGTVESGSNETRTITRVDGRPAVTFSIYRTQTASEVTTGRKVRE